MLSSICGNISRKLMSSILILILTLSVFACSDSELTDVEYLREAKQHYQQGNLRTAGIELKNALQKNPQNIEARWLLGEVSLEMGDYAAAEKEFRKAISQGLERKAVALALAQAMLKQGKFTVLLEEFSGDDLSLAEQPEFVAIRMTALVAVRKLDDAEAELLSLDANAGKSNPILVAKARLAMARAKLDEARGFAEAAVESNVKYADGWSILGDIERLENNSEKAEQAYNNAVDSRLNNDSDRLKRALVRIFANKFTEARQDLDILRRRAPRNPEVNYTQGLFHFQQKNYVAAKEYFEKAIAGKSNHLDAAFFLGVSNLKTDNINQALANLNRVYALAPGTFKVAKMTALARFKSKDLAGAEAILEKLIKSEDTPDDPLIFNMLGNIYIAQGKLNEANDLLDKAIALAPDSTDTRLKLGAGLLSQGNEERAIKELQTAVDLDPEFEQADIMLTLAYLRLERFAEAIQSAEHFIQKNPKQGVARSLQGLAFIGLGETAQARAAFEEALKIEPGEPTAAHRLVAMELKDNNAVRAELLLEQVLTSNANHLPTLLALAELRLKAGDKTRFEALLYKAVKGNPNTLAPSIILGNYYLQENRPQDVLRLLSVNNPQVLRDAAAQLLLGRVKYATNDYAQAQSYLTAAIELNPSLHDAHYYLARVYMQRGEQEQAKKAFQQAKKIAPDNLHARMGYIGLLALENNFSEAKAALAELKRKYPDSTEVLSLEGWMKTTENEPETAVKIYQKALEKQPSPVNVIGLAEAHWNVGDQDTSKAVLKDWLAQHPDDARVLSKLANTHIVLGETEEAKKLLRIMLKKDSKNVSLLNNLAWWERKENPVQALKYIEQAYEISPKSPSILDTYGLILLQQGDVEKASRMLQSANRMVPDNPGIKYHLALVLDKKGEKQAAKAMVTDALNAVKKDKTFTELDAAKALLEKLSK